jgi:hypothetical protein
LCKKLWFKKDDVVVAKRIYDASNFNLKKKKTQIEEVIGQIKTGLNNILEDTPRIHLESSDP